MCISGACIIFFCAGNQARCLEDVCNEVLSFFAAEH